MNQTEPMTITIRPLIKYLGLFVGIVMLVPPAIAAIMMIASMGSENSNSVWAIIPLGIAAVLMFGMYRWMTIKGSVDENEITLNGFLFRIRVPTSQVAEAKRVESRFISYRYLIRGMWQKAVHFDLLDDQGHRIARVPEMLLASPNWKIFWEHLQSISEKTQH